MDLSIEQRASIQKIRGRRVPFKTGFIIVIWWGALEKKSKEELSKEEASETWNLILCGYMHVYSSV